MLFLNQWRLPILFVISGMGTAYALSFRNSKQFIGERARRLGIPLLFGSLVIVSPQVLIERWVDGDFSGSYFDWYLSGSFIDGIYPSGNFSWHHLWFLPYLLVFSLILTPIFIQLRNNPEGKFLSWLRRRLKSNPYFLLWLILPLYLYEALLEPFFEVTHNLVWDWFNFVSSLTLFFYGFLLISVREAFWNAVGRIWKWMIVLGVCMFTIQLCIWFFLQDSIWVHFFEALIKVTNLWAWILAIFGLAALFLNKKSSTLTYANRAVYPFYILHQTVTIIIGFFLHDVEMSFLPKFLIMLLGTFMGCFLVYEFVIRRLKIFWPLFGLKG